MNKRHAKVCTIFLAALLVTATVFETSAFARAGGGRSFGSRGSRGFSLPSRSYQPSPSRPGQAPYQPSQSPRQSGSFLRSLGGGIMGGFLGGMLFRSLGFGSGGVGAGGIGLFEILLICGIGYFIYRMVRKRRQESFMNQAPPPPPADYRMDTTAYAQPTGMPDMTGGNDTAAGLAHIRQMDASFDETGFRDQAMDIFFRIQGAWMNRDLSPVTGYLDDEMRRNLQEDVDRLLREKRINRLENIAVRATDLVEAWQESGHDFITVRFYANLLDYTTDDMGNVVEGNRSEPVKFEEYWTFTRPVGAGAWKLSAISQA